MREKVPTLIITFPTTTQAMQMEEKCRLHHAPGRMIPVPGEVSAGCGLAWSTQPIYRKDMDLLIKEQDIQIEAMTEILF